MVAQAVWILTLLQLLLNLLAQSVRSRMLLRTATSPAVSPLAQATCRCLLAVCHCEEPLPERWQSTTLSQMLFQVLDVLQPLSFTAHRRPDCTEAARQPLQRGSDIQCFTGPSPTHPGGMESAPPTTWRAVDLCTSTHVSCSENSRDAISTRHLVLSVSRHSALFPSTRWSGRGRRSSGTWP